MAHRDEDDNEAKIAGVTEAYETLSAHGTSPLFPTFSQPKNMLNSIFIYFQIRKATLTLGETWTPKHCIPSITNIQPPPPCTPPCHHLPCFNAGKACLVTASTTSSKTCCFQPQPWLSPSSRHRLAVTWVRVGVRESVIKCQSGIFSGRGW